MGQLSFVNRRHMVRTKTMINQVFSPFFLIFYKFVEDQRILFSRLREIQEEENERRFTFWPFVRVEHEPMP